MPGGEEKTASSGRETQPADGVASQVLGMIAALWASRQRNKIVMLSLALLAVVGATAYAQIRLNAWNQPFYDALAHKNVSTFLTQLGVFGELAGVLLVLNVAQAWLNQESKLVLREGLVEDLVSEWLAPARAFRISHAGEIGENPDQRIHEDARHLTELTTDLGIGLLQSSLLLLSFVGVLWVLSSTMVLSIAGNAIVAPGYMVWCALLYAGVASLLSWRVGRTLIGLNETRYAREAQFRFALVRVNEEIEGVTLYAGEADEGSHLNWVFSSVVQVLERIVFATTGLTWVTAGVGWLAMVAPILVAAPAYFYSGMSFGALMMIVGAFNQVQQSLGWFASNFSGIADWRATLLRVASFRKAMLTMDKLGESESRIKLDEWDDQSILIYDLRIAAPSGCIMLNEAHAELKPGEHVLVVGDEDDERLLFQAIAGLWPWGAGRIARPARQFVLFAPTPGYAPPGTLRASLAYPHPAELYGDARISKAIAAVGLEHLAPMLDETERWDRLLSDDEKQSLAVARVILQRPRWVVFNRALTALDPALRRRLTEVVAQDSPDLGVLYIGRLEDESAFYGRVLKLVRDPNGPCFKPSVEPGATDRRETAALPAE
ncbi:MAG TPA: ABC transporter ATP-binding protein/permease [Roseiarcus sp.]|nr:ABC transporter ATP-binding protein/permease [Roseiarcus sp.]